MQQEYFVYDGQEVTKTGRIASKEQQVRGYSGTRMVLENVVEITPVLAPGEYAWKRWVREDELYVINDSRVDQPPVEFPVDVPVTEEPPYDEVDKILQELRDKNNGTAT